MDFAEAGVFSEKLLAGEPVAGWTLLKKISHGKSAVIMLAKKGGMTAAVKVFHSGLIEKYGRDAQLIRLHRERSLINRQHPNLIKILDSGCCETTGHLFVVMDYASGIPLSEALKKIPRKNIASIIEYLARAARQLEDWGFTHRDIKPENIHIDSETFSDLILLDFGVVKPHGDDSATNLQVSTAFLGTHQYSPPEMIHGREADTLDGWRAITFYQLGAVLHDLITCEPIFGYATSRHADLVFAIDNNPVIVTSDDVDPLLCNLATRCLLKNPSDRLEVVRWEDFFFSDQAKNKPSLDYRKQALLRQLKLGEKLSYVDALEISEDKRLYGIRLMSIIRSARNEFNDALAKLGELTPERTTILDGNEYPAVGITYIFTASPKLGLDSPFKVQVSVEMPPEDSSLVKLFLRASKGLDDTEIGWTPLGPTLPSLDGVSDNIQEWMISIIEEMTKK